MPAPPDAPGPAPSPQQVVGGAVQELAATRLGRAFVPLTLLLLMGLGGILTGRGTESFLVAIGAPLSAGAMLAYGLRVAEWAFGRPRRAWMAWSAMAGILPPTYGIWVLAWLGLRGVAMGGGLAPVSAGVVSTALGFWTLRSWLRIVELQRLAEAMTLQLPSGQGEEG